MAKLYPYVSYRNFINELITITLEAREMQLVIAQKTRETLEKEDDMNATGLPSSAPVVASHPLYASLSTPMPGDPSKTLTAI